MNLEIKEQKMEFAITGIEILNFSLNTPTDKALPEFVEFNFNITIQNRIDETKKMIFVIVNVDIQQLNEPMPLGSFSASCIFNVVNFTEVVTKNKQGLFEINTNFQDVLNSISISTTRGLMFSNFKGTILHGAVLPLMNPKAPIKEEVKRKSVHK